MKVKGERTVAKTWARRASAAARDYEAGLASPKRGEAQQFLGAPEMFAAAVASSRSAYARGWAPYRDVLLKLNLPPRGKVGSRVNLRRAFMVNEALHKEKLRLAKLSKKRPRGAV